MDRSHQTILHSSFQRTGTAPRPNALHWPNLTPADPAPTRARTMRNISHSINPSINTHRSLPHRKINPILRNQFLFIIPERTQLHKHHFPLDVHNETPRWAKPRSTTPPKSHSFTNTNPTIHTLTTCTQRIHTEYTHGLVFDFMQISSLMICTLHKRFSSFYQNNFAQKFLLSTRCATEIYYNRTHHQYNTSTHVPRSIFQHRQGMHSIWPSTELQHPQLTHQSNFQHISTWHLLDLFKHTKPCQSQNLISFIHLLPI